MFHAAGTGSTARPHRRHDPTGPAWARRAGALAGRLSFAQRVLESSACPILLIDGSADPVIGYVSPALETLTGYAAHELVGRPWTLFFALAESGAAGLNDAGRGPRADPRIRVALSARHKRGAMLHLDATVASLHDDAGLATHRVLMLRDVTAERLERAKLEQRALHDPLTGLANRHLLHDRFELALARARRHQEPFAVVMVDLDDFKRVNDRFGHDVGDALLEAVGERLKEVVRAEDTVARTGGDEFVLLVTDVKTSGSPPGIMERLRASLGRPMVVASHELTIGCCAGSAQFPDDGDDLASLLKVADERLYSEKASRRPPPDRCDCGG